MEPGAGRVDCLRPERASAQGGRRRAARLALEGGAAPHFGWQVQARAGLFTGADRCNRRPALKFSMEC